MSVAMGGPSTISMGRRHHRRSPLVCCGLVAVTGWQRRGLHSATHAAGDELGDGVVGVLADEQGDLRVGRGFGDLDAARDRADRHGDGAVVLEDLAEQRVHPPERPAGFDAALHPLDMRLDELRHRAVVAGGPRADAVGEAADLTSNLLVADEQVVDGWHVSHHLPIMPSPLIVQPGMPPSPIPDWSP
jgi:hypothetical protein